MNRRLAAGLLAAGSLSALPLPAPAGNVILQYFEGQWSTIERRAPDIFMARYNAVWVPPPGKADTGGYSVGYDCYDRFNLGAPYDRTLYGTEQSFVQMSREFDKGDVGLYIDAIVNHNGFRDLGTPGFVNGGDYPGFVVTLPDDIDGDFHGGFEGGVEKGRLAGLIDIAQEKNHRFTRNPVPGATNNIPNETPREENRKLYPDLDGPEEYGRHKFNTADPMAGDPYEENATGLLMRYLQWMVETKGVDGFRIDAMKHVPTFFYNDYYDFVLYNSLRNPIDGSAFTPFSFGEHLETQFEYLNPYFRKDGYGNRDLLDFPLFYKMRDVFNAQGFGDMRALEFGSYDGADGNFNDGSRGVMFVNSHDNDGAGYTDAGFGYNMLAHAHILTRTGYPCVYYNAKEFGDNRDFPRPGRREALGNYSNVLTRLLRVNKEYVRGGHATRWVDESVYIYERVNACIIGLNDRGDGGFDERWINTGFPGGTVLVELTGNATSATVDPLDDIWDSVTVQNDGRVAIRVPRNRSAQDVFHGRGYVVYGPAKPTSVLSITNESGIIDPDPADGRPEGARRLTPLHIVTADTINVALDVESSPASDNALIKVNFGEVDVDGDGNRNANGEFAGFESFPSVGGGIYSASIDATHLREGCNYIETVAFLQRPAGSATIYDNERIVVYLDRLPPQVGLDYPKRTGSGDIASKTYEAVFSSDHTVNALHVLKNVSPTATDEEILAMVNDSNKATHRDRLEWRYLLTGLSGSGTTMELTAVAFEESGNHSITRFDNIGLDLAYPDTTLAVDTNGSPSAETIEGMPNSINTSAYPNEIVVRVNTQDVPGGPVSFANDDFSVTLQVDDEEPMVAQAFNASLLPPVGRLVQNDQNLGDGIDEFRFVWRGYGTGSHRFHAVAQLTKGSVTPAEDTAFIDVAADTAGPAVTITEPAPPGETADKPTQILVEGTFDASVASAQVFLDGAEGNQLVATLNAPPAGNFSVSRPVGSYAVTDTITAGALQVVNGDYTIRVIASTGANGGGISSEATSGLTITGLQVPPELAPLNADGTATEMLNTPLLAVSAADGATGTADPKDFGGDGTLTELHGAIRNNVLGIALRGDMFGADETNNDNVSVLFIDVNGGSGQGAKNLATELTDEADGLRRHISKAAFQINTALTTAGVGFDAAFGMTDTNVAYGYTFGTDGLPGSFSDFAFNASFKGSYDDDTAAFPAAAGATIPGPDTFEIAIPLAALGNPDPRKLRFVAVTAADSGFPSPNTLPENTSNAFDASQTLEGVAQFPGSATILINEVFVGASDWVELYNPDTSAVDMSGWVLRMDDSDNAQRDYVFGASTSLASHAYLVISDESFATPPANTPATKYTGFNIPWNESRGGSVALVDTCGIGIDYVDWRNASDDEATDPVRNVPAGTAFTGTVVGAASLTGGDSLARNAASADTDAASDWDPTSGANAFVPTPGAVNVSAPPVLPGDANGDTFVTPSDAQAAFNCYMLGACGGGISSDAADIFPDDGDTCVDAADGNSQVTPEDAQRIFQRALGVIPACP